MRDALDLLAIVLDGASRLGQAVSTERYGNAFFMGGIDAELRDAMHC